MFILLFATGSGAYNSNYYVLLIPAGAIICLVIKKLSDIDSTNKRVTIRECGDAECVEVIKIEKTLLQSILDRVKMLDNKRLAVKGMALKINAFADAMADEIGSELQESELTRCVKSIKKENRIVHGNLICSSGTPYLEANARSYYDRAILNGALNIKKKTNARKFLELYEFVCYTDLCQNSIRHQPRAERIKIGVLNKTELGELACSEVLYNKGSALLLFQELNNSVEVIKC